jgi:hypothetical protein
MGNPDSDTDNLVSRTRGKVSVFVGFRGLTSFNEAANESFFSPLCFFLSRIFWGGLAAHKKLVAQLSDKGIYPQKLQ